MTEAQRQHKHRTENGHCGISRLSFFLFCANAFKSLLPISLRAEKNVFYDAIQFRFESILCGDEMFLDFIGSRNETSLVT